MTPSQGSQSDPLERQILLFYGDQTDNTVPCIKSLHLQARYSVLLERYLTGCCRALQIQVSELDPIDRRGIPAFDSILDLAESHEKSDRSSALVTLLLCYIARLGELILHAEDDPTFFTTRTTVLGLCVGLIPATIGAAARSASEVVELGIEFIPLCVKVGVASMQRDRRVEDSEDGCWGYVIKQLPSEELQKIIDEFHRLSHIPTHQRVFISVLGPNWSTLMGPPHTLGRFMRWSHTVSEHPLIPFPIRGLAHVPHLPPLDLDTCMGNSKLLDRPIPKHLSIMSTSTCAPYTGETLRSVLLEGMRDASERPLRLVDTITAVLKRVGGHGGAVHLAFAGPTMQAKNIENSLAKSGLRYQLTKPVSSKPTVGREVQGLSGVPGRIAVVGMAGRFPQSDNIHEFWELMLAGVDTHTQIPADRFPVKEYFDATGAKKNSTSARHGCFINSPGQFDTRLFNVSPREAFQMDPVQRLLLMTTHEALEDAGFNNSGVSASSHHESSKVAVYVGQCTDQWRDICVKHGVDIFSITGLLRAFAPGRLNYHFKFGGPSYSLDAACSSSSTAITLACSALREGSIDVAVAGGAQLSNTPLEFAGLSKAGFLSTTGGCKTFRADADGYCRGEGVGMVILKRLEDALRDNDNIHSVISGWGRNHSANAISITHPHAETQQRLYRKVLQQACVDPKDVGYIEMHGTGTQAGDSAEMASVAAVFAPSRSRPLYVGAVKANVGHSEAAAGVTGVVKASLMLKNGVIPPQAGMPSKLNPDFPDLARLHVRIPSEELSFDGKQRKVFVNNFDAAGGNTCLMLEEGPPKPLKTPDPRGWHVVTCSARTAAALRGNKQRLFDYLTAPSNAAVSLADLGYSTTARRTHEMLRASYVGSSVDKIVLQLKSDLQNQDNHLKRKAPRKGAIVFMFTGQGSHYPGMAGDLFRSSTRFRHKILSLEDTARVLGLPSFLGIITDTDIDMETRSTAQVQLAVLCLEIALADLWMSWGIKPAVVIGHSLGEYAALCVAGVISVSDTLFLVGRRAALIQERVAAGECAMLSAAASADDIQKHLAVSGYGRTCQISCYNASNSTVISGSVDDLHNLDDFLVSKGARTKFLQVPYAFHSPQLDNVLEDLEACAGQLKFSAPKIPVVSTMTGQLVQVGDHDVFNAAYMAQQARQPVRFFDALQSLMAQQDVVVDQNSLWLEIGPNPVCASFVKSTLNVVSNNLLASLKARDSDYKTICASLAQTYRAGQHIDWHAYHKDCLDLGSVSLLDGLPTYAFDTKDFWDVFDVHTNPAMSSLPAGPKNPADSSAAPEPSRPRFKPTSSLQEITAETVTPDQISVTFESSTADDKLSEAIRGHLVNGAALCPTSVFSDMAVGAARYIWALAHPDAASLLDEKEHDLKVKVPAISIHDLDIFNALVLEPSSPTKKSQQVICVTATAVAKPDNSWTNVQINFGSTSGSKSGKASDREPHDNGRCRISFGDAGKIRAAWSKNAHLVKARTDAMMSPQKADTMVRLQRPFIYKLFNSVVRYDDKYHGLHEVFMDEDMQDAVAVVRLKSGDSLATHGKWTLTPYWSDSIVHLAGFVMNCTSRNKENTAHISGGLDCMTLTCELSDQQTYHSYVCMRAGEKRGSSIGDVYVLAGSEIVAYAEGVKFQQMPLSILNVVLGIGNENPRPPPAVRSVEAAAAAAAAVAALPGEPAPIIHRTRTSSQEKSLALDGVTLGIKPPPETTRTSSSSAASSGDTAPSSTDGKTPEDEENARILEALLDAVIAETAFDVNDMDDSTEFSDMGVDSLMSIAIIDAVRRKTGITLPVSLFLDLSTVGDFRRKFAPTAEPQSQTSDSESWADPPKQQQMEDDVPDLATSHQEEEEDDDEEYRTAEESRNNLLSVFQIAGGSAKPPGIDDHMVDRPAAFDLDKYSSNVVLMQGDSRSDKTPLFLICDGAGSAAAYAQVPRLPSGTPVYALESPFLRRPLDFTCTLEQVSTLYRAAIKSTRPAGPYLIGGWSAGAVYAYEVSRQLLASGREEDRVQGLILIDMKVPRPNLSVAPPTMDAVGQASLVTRVHGERAIFETAELGQAVKEHLLASALCVRKYEPQPMRGAHRQPAKGTFIIWARWGLCDTLLYASDMEDIGRGLPADPAGKNVMFDNELDMRTFLFSKRRVYGVNGWDKLVGAEKTETVVIDGDHFSIVRKPNVTALAENIERALEKFNSE